MEYFAAERAEVLVLTFGVGTLDPCDAPGVVAADQEAFHGFYDALLTVLAEPYGELSVVASEQLGKKGSKEPP